MWARSRVASSSTTRSMPLGCHSSPSFASRTSTTNLPVIHALRGSTIALQVARQLSTRQSASSTTLTNRMAIGHRVALTTTTGMAARPSLLLSPVKVGFFASISLSVVSRIRSRAFECQTPPRPSKTLADRVFASETSEEHFLVTSESFATLFETHKTLWGKCCKLIRWAKYIVGTSLSLICGYLGLHYSRWQPELARKLLFPIIGTAAPLLVTGYIMRIVAVAMFAASSAFAFASTLTYWAQATVPASQEEIAQRLASEPKIQEYVGDWGSQLKPHMDTFRITLPGERSSMSKLTVPYSFTLVGSHGEAVVRVLVQQTEEQHGDFLEALEEHNAQTTWLLLPFSSPRAFPTIPQMPPRKVELYYLDVTTTAGPNKGERVVLLDRLAELYPTKDEQ